LRRTPKLETINLKQKNLVGIKFILIKAEMARRLTFSPVSEMKIYLQKQLFLLEYRLEYGADSHCIFKDKSLNFRLKLNLSSNSGNFYEHIF